jgi:hypothetical protein
VGQGQGYVCVVVVVVVGFRMGARGLQIYKQAPGIKQPGAASCLLPPGNDQHHGGFCS